MKAVQQCTSILLAILLIGIVSGQSGLVNEYGDVLPAPPPPTLKISEVVKEQTFEHHVAARLRTSPPPIAPALAPDAGAPAPGFLSVYDLLPPEEGKVVGVASVAMPGAVAAGPQPLHNLTYDGDTLTQIDRPAPANASAPSDILWNVSPDDNATQLKAVQTFAPPAPVAFVSADGSLIFVGPSSPSAYAGSSSAPATHWLWPTIALLGLVGIVGSIAWAYSKRRQRRYLDLKDTELAMQSRPHNPV